MTVEYKREMNRNYMVIKPDSFGGGKYAEKMLTENCIFGLLTFSTKRIDGQTWFYYDITSRQPLSRIMEVRALTGPELRQILSDLLFTLKQLECFLLDEGQLDLEPEYIYIEPETFRCFLCLIPGRYESFSERFCDFSKYLLDHVCHTDTEAVVLAFGIFQESRKPNFGMENMERLMRQNPPESSVAEETTEESDTEEKHFRRPTFEKDGEWTGTGGLEMKRTVVPLGNNSLFGAASKVLDADLQQRKIKRCLEAKGGVKAQSTVGLDREKRNAGIKTAAMIVLVLIMLSFPAGLLIRLGIAGLMRYKWFLIGGEICMALLAMILRDFGTAPGSDSEQGEGTGDSIGSEKYADQDHCYSNGVFKATERLAEKTGEWEYAMRRDERIQEEEENDLQTVLLTAVPENEECCRLVPIMGGEEILISYFPFIIGKNRELADFCMDDPGVSRLHLRIDKKEGSYEVADLNSKNGTRVDGKALEANERCNLKKGDVVEIAGRGFRFL